MKVTDIDWESLGHRAIACAGWKWLPGVLRDDGTRVTRMSPNGPWFADWEVRPMKPVTNSCTTCTGHYAKIIDPDAREWREDAWPDLRDPATVGCLLALVREAWGDPRIEVGPALFRDARENEISHWHCWSSRSWCPDTDSRPCSVTGATEAEALVTALEASKKRA